MSVAAVTNIDVTGWACFAVGLAVLVAGVFNGLGLSPRSDSKVAATTLADAKKKIDETKGHIAQTAGGGGLESGGALDAAGASADAAKTALEQVQGIVAALPENLRFSGLLVLIGTVLMGVATIQFGHVALF